MKRDEEGKTKETLTRSSSRRPINHVLQDFLTEEKGIRKVKVGGELSRKMVKETERGVLAISRGERELRKQAR